MQSPRLPNVTGFIAPSQLPRTARTKWLVPQLQVVAAAFETQFQTKGSQPTTDNRFRSVGPAPPQSLQPQGRYSPTAAESTVPQIHTATPPQTPPAERYIPAPGSPSTSRYSPESAGKSPRPQWPSRAAIPPASCSVPVPSAPARRSSGT